MSVGSVNNNNVPPSAGLRLPTLKRKTSDTQSTAEGTAEGTSRAAKKSFENAQPKSPPISNVSVLGIETSVSSTVVAPTSLKECLQKFLRPHQLEAVDRILEQKRLILADEMGLGKTLTALSTVLTYLREGEEKKGPFLIICPLDLISTWQNEIRKINRVLTDAGLNDLSIREMVYKASSKKPLDENADLVLVNYETFAAPAHREKLLDFPYSGIVCDESSYVKTFKAKRSEAVADACANINPEIVVLLNGTPMENRLEELCGQLHVLRPNIFNASWKKLFQSVNSYIVDYIQLNLALKPDHIEDMRDKIRNLVQEALTKTPSKRSEDNEEEENRLNKVQSVGDAIAYTRDLMHNYVLHRTKSDLGPNHDLTPPLYHEILWKMDAWQLKLYEEWVQTLKKDPDKPGHTLQLLLKLNQVCNHPSLLPELKRVYAIAETKKIEKLKTSSGKMEELAIKLDGLLAQENNRAVIFVHQIETGKLIQEYLKARFGLDVRFVQGDDSVQVRDAKIRASSDGVSASDRVLIITDGTGSVGRNMAQFNHLFNFDIPWSKSKWDQQVARIYREGQKQQPHVYSFICKNNPFMINLDRIYREMYVAKKVAVDAPSSRDVEALVDLFFTPKKQLITAIFDDLDKEPESDISSSPASIPSKVSENDGGPKQLLEIHDMLQNDADFKDLEIDGVEDKRLNRALNDMESLGYYDPNLDPEEAANAQEKSERNLHTWKGVEEAVQWFFNPEYEDIEEDTFLLTP